jgi:hypothetical protein
MLLRCGYCYDYVLRLDYSELYGVIANTVTVEQGSWGKSSFDSEADLVQATNLSICPSYVRYFRMSASCHSFLASPAVVGVFCASFFYRWSAHLARILASSSCFWPFRQPLGFPCIAACFFFCKSSQYLFPLWTPPSVPLVKGLIANGRIQTSDIN